MKDTLRRWFWKFARLFGILVVLWLLISGVLVYRLTQRMHRQRPEPKPILASINLSEEVFITQDGERIGAWHLPNSQQKPVILLVHCNGDTRRGMLPQAEWLNQLGHPTVLITVRAHGDSSGETNDFGYSARFDVLAACDWINQQYPGRGVIIWGRSLGSAAALFASQELGHRVQGYVLECPYADLATATRNRTKMKLPVGVEYVAYVGLCLTAYLMLPNAADIAPLQAAKHIPPEAKVLILAGEADLHATPAEAQAIQDVLGERSELVVISGAAHVELEATNPKLYRDAITQFLKKL